MTNSPATPPAPKPDPSAKKPYVRLSGTLVMVGAGLFALERYGLSEAKAYFGSIDPNILSVLVILPVAMIIAGALIFMIGRMRRL